MAFLKLVGSIVLGGGLGYVLLQIASPDESEIVKYLPPHSSQKQSLFKHYKQQPEEFMSKDKLNTSFKKYKQDSANTIEK